MKRKQIFILTLAFCLLISSDYLSVWAAPAANPPAGNSGIPITDSNLPQNKVGNLTVGTLITPRIHSGQYCNQSGTQCLTAASVMASESSGIGYAQQWQWVSRSQWVWYRNETSKPISVFNKNIRDGTVVRIGPSTTDYAVLDFRDLDSSALDNGFAFIIPVGHWYLFERNPAANGGTMELR